MKIAIFDQVNKFTQPLIDNWIINGHEIKKDKSWDPRLVSWGDITFFEFCDNSIMRASDPGDSFYQNPEFGIQPKGKKIITRIHDIDAWVGNHTRVQWDWISDVVFVAEHIKNKVLSDIEFPPNVKIHMIKHGIDTSKFIYREKERGKKIAWVGNINDHKKLEFALLILAELPRDYSLYIVGQGLGSWREAYIKNYIEHNKLNVEFQEHVESINDFLEDKDFLISTGTKEAFSFVSGEAMSKGIKTLIHNFYGADTVWKDYFYVWNTVSEAVSMIEEEQYIPSYFRNYIEQNYPMDQMLHRYNEILLNT